MRKRAIGLFALAGGLLSASLPLFAHHGTAVFDTGKAVTMKGSVTEWLWSNPHCLLQFDVKNEGGQAVHWIAETQNPAEMVSLGWGTTSFKPGDEVTVTLIPVKNGRAYGRIKLVVLPSGKTLETRDGNTDPVKKLSDGSSGSAKPENDPKQ